MRVIRSIFAELRFMMLGVIVYNIHTTITPFSFNLNLKKIRARLYI